MSRMVQKFGGTSVGSIKRIQRAAELVAKTVQQGHQVVVVVSAMSGETDRLIALAQDIMDNPDAREYAALIATGEQASVALLAMCLIKMGVPARSYTGAQAGIITNDQYKKARILDINTTAIETDLALGKVVVVAGFQGVDANNNITTLGRGGSDTTAVALANAIKASECQIYTDVDGVYTTDPRIVPAARRLTKISFGEMLEFASLGAKVLQLRAVEFAGKYNVPIRVLSASSEGAGTLISCDIENTMESPLVTGIAYSRSEAKIIVEGFSDGASAASILTMELSNINVNADMLLQHQTVNNEYTLTFTLHRDEYQQALLHLQKHIIDIGAKRCFGVDNLAKVSIIGAGLKSHPEVAPMMFRALASQGIHIQLISTSELKISVVIDNTATDTALISLHKTFNLEQPLALVKSEVL